MPEASALNMFVAAVSAAAFDWVIIAGVTAARAAASAAALRRVLFCAAEVKSKPIPVKKMMGMRDNANMIAALPLRSRMNRRMKTPRMAIPYGRSGNDGSVLLGHK